MEQTQDSREPGHRICLRKYHRYGKAIKNSAKKRYQILTGEGKYIHTQSAGI